jgi:oligosaccharide reducing-end xylanase
MSRSRSPRDLWPLAAFLLCLLLASAPCAAQARRDRGAGAFAPGRYRNLFVEIGQTPEEVSGKIRAAFQQLFHGDPNTESVYYPAGKNANGPLAYIEDIIHNDVRSEGMSYGMMIAVQLDKKPEFDAIWNWARTYMYREQAGHPGRGYFSWSMKTNGTPNDEMPAPDAEEYFIMSLYFASARWGNGTGIYNYKAEADRILTDVLHRERITGPTAFGERTAEAQFDAEHAMVRFAPTSDSLGYTDPSYHLPGFYELWARWGPEADRPFWAKAAAVSREFFQRSTNPVTGLAPDYANFDGTPRAGRGNPGSVNFRFDAWRTAMNWSFDWSWWEKDPRERQLSDRIQAFFESKGMSDYGNQFTLAGEQFGNDHAPGLVSMNAVASLAATNPRARKFVEALWALPVPSGRGRYYDGLLYLMALMHCGAEYRIWTPK